MMRLLRLFQTGPDLTPVALDPAELRRTYERRRWSVFLSAIFGYGLYYVCRINFSVVKKPLLDAGTMTAREMGLVGSALLTTYAGGKLVNGFLADRSNIRRFISSALLASALLNLVLGAMDRFVVFFVLWGLNGWCQSVGSASCVVGLSHWFSLRERGTRYGIWSASHSIGEGLTFAVTSTVVAALGWRWGFWGPALVGIAGSLTLFRTLADRPQTYGLPPVWEYRREPPPEPARAESMGALQREVARNGWVWVLGAAFAALSATRYAISSWGMLYLQTSRGYSLGAAGTVVATYPLLALLGSVCSGFLSDRLFGSRRHPLALILGLITIGSLLALYLVPVHSALLDAAIFAGFGFCMGGLLVLFGLMVIDLVPPRVAGAAAGLSGMIAYAGAALQDTVSGALIDAGKRVIDGQTTYAFDYAFLFWIGAMVLAVGLMSLTWGRTRAV